jgi:hypothetical protein
VEEIVDTHCLKEENRGHPLFEDFKQGVSEFNDGINQAGKLILSCPKAAIESMPLNANGMLKRSTPRH